MALTALKELFILFFKDKEFRIFEKNIESCLVNDNIPKQSLIEFYSDR